MSVRSVQVRSKAILFLNVVVGDVCGRLGIVIGDGYGDHTALFVLVEVGKALQFFARRVVARLQPAQPELALVNAREQASQDRVTPPQVKGVNHPVLHSPAFHDLHVKRARSFQPQETASVQSQAKSSASGTARARELAEKSHASALGFTGNNL